jgi:hypothetical protein
MQYHNYHNFFDSINVFNKQNGYLSDYHLIKNYLIQVQNQSGGIGEGQQSQTGTNLMVPVQDKVRQNPPGPNTPGALEIEEVREAREGEPFEHIHEITQGSDVPSGSRVIEVTSVDVNLGSQNTGLSEGEIKRDFDKALERIEREDEETRTNKITVVQGPESAIGKSDVSHTTVHIIRPGTVLHHGTMMKTFNVKDIRLGPKDIQGNRKLPAYFSPQIRLAADRISACVNPEGGYIHKFITKRELSIVILDPYSLPDDWSLDYFNEHYCRNDQYYGKIDGVGFYFPKKSQYKFSDQKKISGGEENDEDIDFEVVLCNPSADLDYVNTSSCISLRNLSNPYNFVAGND